MAVRINLLPWREERRKQKQLEFNILMGVAVAIAGLTVYGVYMKFEQDIAVQNERNQYLQNEIAQLKKAEEELKELEKIQAGLISRMDVIRRLQASRPEMVRAFDSLVRLLPEDLYLSSMAISGVQLELKGIAVSNNIVSEFMRNLGDSVWFEEPELTLIKNEDLNNNRVSVFELKVKRELPKELREPETAAAKPPTPRPAPPR